MRVRVCVCVNADHLSLDLSRRTSLTVPPPTTNGTHSYPPPNTTTDANQYVLAMFLAYPLAGVMSLLPSAQAKHAFAFLVGLWCVSKRPRFQVGGGGREHLHSHSYAPAHTSGGLEGERGRFTHTATHPLTPDSHMCVCVRHKPSKPNTNRYAQEIFGAQWIFSFATSLVSYLICALAPQKHIASLVRAGGLIAGGGLLLLGRRACVAVAFLFGGEVLHVSRLLSLLLSCVRACVHARQLRPWDDTHALDPLIALPFVHHHTHA